MGNRNTEDSFEEVSIPFGNIPITRKFWLAENFDYPKISTTLNPDYPKFQLPENSEYPNIPTPEINFIENLDFR